MVPGPQRSGRHARGRALIIDTGYVTPGTRATGGTAKLVGGPGSPTWRASKGPGQLFDVLRCRV